MAQLFINSGVLKTSKWLHAMDALIIGPGLGRDVMMQEQAHKILQKTQEHNNLVVIDADGLFFLGVNKDFQQTASTIGSKLVLTPNQVEFKRLFKVLHPLEHIWDQEIRNIKLNQLIGEECVKEISIGLPCIQDLCKLSQSFGDCVVLLKGKIDLICNGKSAYAVCSEGS